MSTFLKWRPPRWGYGVVALLAFAGGWLFVLPDREPEIDFQFFALTAWYLVTIVFALLSWPSWLSLVVLVLVGFSLSIYADPLVNSSQFHFVLLVLASVGCVLLFRKHRSTPTLLLIIGCVGCTIVVGLNAFFRFTRTAALDAFGWTHGWLEWLSKVGGFAIVCLPIALVLFIRRRNASVPEKTKWWPLLKRGMGVMLGVVLVWVVLYAISRWELVMDVVRGSRMAHSMPGWTEMRSKYSAPFASSNMWMGSRELRIGVRSKRPDLLDSATWLIDLSKGKPTETWNGFDQEFTRAREAISRKKWLADWKLQQRGRSVELWVKGDRSHAISKGRENLMRHVWEQFGLEGNPRFYVLARRTGYSTIDFAFNEDGSVAVAEESAERKRSELSSHWLDHLRYRNWGKDGVFNNEFTVINADGQWQSRIYTRGLAQHEEEYGLYIQ